MLKSTSTPRLFHKFPHVTYPVTRSLLLLYSFLIELCANKSSFLLVFQALGVPVDRLVEAADSVSVCYSFLFLFLTAI